MRDLRLSAFSSFLSLLFFLVVGIFIFLICFIRGMRAQRCWRTRTRGGDDVLPILFGGCEFDFFVRNEF